MLNVFPAANISFIPSFHFQVRQGACIGVSLISVLSVTAFFLWLLSACDWGSHPPSTLPIQQQIHQVSHYLGRDLCVCNWNSYGPSTLPTSQVHRCIQHANKFYQVSLKLSGEKITITKEMLVIGGRLMRDWQKAGSIDRTTPKGSHRSWANNSKLRKSGFEPDNIQWLEYQRGLTQGAQVDFELPTPI